MSEGVWGVNAGQSEAKKSEISKQVQRRLVGLWEQLVVIFGSLGLVFRASSQQQTDTQETAEDRQPVLVTSEGEARGGGGALRGAWHEHELRFSWTLRRKAGSYQEGWVSLSPALSLSPPLSWWVFIQRPLVSYQLKGLGECFSAVLRPPPPLLCNLSSLFLPSSTMVAPSAIFHRFNISLHICQCTFFSLI